MNPVILEVFILFLSIGIFAVLLFRSKHNQGNDELLKKINDLQVSVSQMDGSLKNDFRVNREESTVIARDNRRELNESLRDLKTELSQVLQSIIQQNQSALELIHKTLDEKIGVLSQKIDNNNKNNREELAKNITDFSGANVLQLEKINSQAKDDCRLIRESLVTAFRGFQETFDNNIRAFNELQREKFGLLDVKQNELVKSTETRLESIRVTVEEKLEKTLSERLGQSFETVGKQLIEVQKGLGEMQTLAQDVGGLKKVLSNVKMRGGFGEVQLRMLLENILAPDQYESNVKIKTGTIVEFAIKLPNPDSERNQVWLPIDAKFPRDVYDALQSAYDIADPVMIEEAQKKLEATIKKMAKDICTKYIDPPFTTDFAILFLPFEGIYAEVVRKASLLEELQRECKVIVTGPTTLAAILNSLQMGFRTLAIQKRSSEVWQVLAAVKKEFETFGGMLGKAQSNIQTGLNQLDDVMGIRTRAIQRRLKGVESLGEKDAKLLLEEDSIVEGA